MLNLITLVLGAASNLCWLYIDLICPACVWWVHVSEFGIWTYSIIVGVVHLELIGFARMDFKAIYFIVRQQICYFKILTEIYQYYDTVHIQCDVIREHELHIERCMETYNRKEYLSCIYDVILHQLLASVTLNAVFTGQQYWEGCENIHINQSDLSPTMCCTRWGEWGSL